MDSLPVWFCLILVFFGAVADIASNLVLKKSQGFRLKKWGFAGIVLMLAGMTFSVAAMTKLPLAVVYTLWMAFGVLGTALLGWRVFRQKLHASAWAGILMLVAGIVLIYGG